MRHVILTCKNHPDMRWSCKSIAFTPNQGYNGLRSIFYNTENIEECDCNPKDLILSPEEIEKQKTDPTYDKFGGDI